MGSSIQDYLKKINSRLTLLDCVSLLVTTLFLIVFLLIIYNQEQRADMPVSYIENSDSYKAIPQEETRPFGSKNGKTYTFSWCSRQNMISIKNRIYYTNEEEAKLSGKVLSKFCKK